MVDELPLKILWDRWTTAVATCPLVDRVSRPALLPHLRAVDAAQQSDLPHTLALSGIPATDQDARTALTAAGPGAVAAGWPAPPPGVEGRTENAIAGYAEALLEARLAILRLLQGARPETVLAQNLASWRNLMVGEEVAGPDDVLPSSVWTAAEQQPSWAARGILLHLALWRARPWPSGTGRTARLVMNTLIAAAGHRWLVIPGTRRQEYDFTITVACDTGDARPFCHLLAACADDDASAT